MAVDKREGHAVYQSALARIAELVSDLAKTNTKRPWSARRIQRTVRQVPDQHLLRPGGGCGVQGAGVEQASLQVYTACFPAKNKIPTEI